LIVGTGGNGKLPFLKWLKMSQWFPAGGYRVKTAGVGHDNRFVLTWKMVYSCLQK
jgi:hypothetical protein